MNSFKQTSFTTDIAFSDSVKAVQQQLGSRGSMQRLERSDTWPESFSDDILRWIGERDSIFLGSASAAGQPYIQHRGGKPGFIKVRDNQTLLIPDYRGNRHYISLGNFAENAQAFIFMIDYETQTRIKFWGEITVENLLDNHRQLVFKIKTWDVNCKQYLPSLWAEKTVRKAQQKLLDRITALEAEVATLKLHDKK